MLGGETPASEPTEDRQPPPASGIGPDDANPTARPAGRLGPLCDDCEQLMERFWAAADAMLTALDEIAEVDADEAAALFDCDLRGAVLALGIAV